MLIPTPTAGGDLSMADPQLLREALLAEIRGHGGATDPLASETGRAYRREGAVLDSGNAFARR